MISSVMPRHAMPCHGVNRSTVMSYRCASSCEVQYCVLLPCLTSPHLALPCVASPCLAAEMLNKMMTYVCVCVWSLHVTCVTSHRVAVGRHRTEPEHMLRGSMCSPTLGGGSVSPHPTRAPGSPLKVCDALSGSEVRLPRASCCTLLGRWPHAQASGKSGRPGKTL